MTGIIINRNHHKSGNDALNNKDGYKMKRKNYDAVIIGGGVIGSAVARELSRYKANVLLLEKDEDVCSGTSKANSAIVHAGFDARPGSLMAKMNVRGNDLMDKVAEELDIPFKRNGAFVLCFDEKDIPKLEELYDRGIKNGVPNIKILSRAEALELEPNLSDGVVAALWAQSSGIICPFSLTLGLAENAADNGVEFSFESEVTGIKKAEGGYLVSSTKGEIETKTIINCAGVYADRMHNFVCSDKIEIKPRKGEYILCDKEEGGLCERTLFQLPTALGKGILVSPTVHGNLLLGPTAEDIEDKEGTNTSAEGLDTVLKKAALSVKQVPSRSSITSFSGLRAHTAADEFILKESEEGFFDCAGIESPGLSSAPAIGEFMSALVAEKLKLEAKDDFNPIRKGVPRLSEMPFDLRAQMIAQNPAYGRIVCRCEMVSEGEILDSIHRTLGAKTLDGVKRRTRAGMGRCQAGFCSPKVMDIISRECGIPLDEIKKNDKNSYIAMGRTNKALREDS